MRQHQGREVDEEPIRNSGTSRNMVDHFAKFRDEFSMDAYVEARRLAAGCKTAERDIFRFAKVIR